MRGLAVLALCLLALGVGRPAAAAGPSDYDWCHANLGGFYEKTYEGCIKSDCARISNKKLPLKRACHNRCKAETLDACRTRRAEAPRETINAGRNALRPQQTPPAAQPRDRGFLSRLFGGREEPAERAAPPVRHEGQPSGARAQPAPPEKRQEQIERPGFLSRVVNSFTDDDAAWCRKNWQPFADVMGDCKRGCVAGAGAKTSRRQACVLNCRKSTVRTCMDQRGL